MIDEALNSGVEGTVEEEFEIVGRQRRRRNTEGQQTKDVEKNGEEEKSGASEQEEDSGCLERLPRWLDGWLAKLREPFLPHVELRSYIIGNIENQTII